MQTSGKTLLPTSVGNRYPHSSVFARANSLNNERVERRFQTVGRADFGKLSRTGSLPVSGKNDCAKGGSQSKFAGRHDGPFEIRTRAFFLISVRPTARFIEIPNANMRAMHADLTRFGFPLQNVDSHQTTLFLGQRGRHEDPTTGTQGLSVDLMRPTRSAPQAC
jgi:hypothetical protein